jgi:hypothetical protein
MDAAAGSSRPSGRMVTHKPSSRQSDLTPLFNPTSSNPRNGDLVPQRVFGFAVTALAQALLAHRPPKMMCAEGASVHGCACATSAPPYPKGGA